MKYLGFILLVLSSSTTALADTDTYISLNVGASIVDDAHQELVLSFPTPVNETVTTTFDFGHTISAALGVSFSDGYRFEVEVANQVNDLVGRSDTSMCCWINGVKTNPFMRYDSKYEGIDGTVTTLLANAYKDFYIVDKFFGYVSGGVGVAFHEWDARSYVEEMEGRLRVHVNNLAVNQRYDETVLAWQLGAGLSYELTKEISLNVGYRYLANDTTPSPFPSPPSSSNDMLHDEDDFGSHNVTAGIRHSF
jgi:opacity protein-like surface antigen